jgi:toxin ParE1/3/4
MGREREELAPGLRSFPFRRYLIFYRLFAGGIEIVRVLHAAQDVPALFGVERKRATRS